MRGNATLGRRASSMAVAVIALTSFWLSVRHYLGQAALTRAAAVVGELGGRCGSIPAEPLGTEVHVDFAKASLSRDQLSRLTVLNSLPRRYFVGIRFADTNLTSEDLHWLHAQIPRCALSLYQNEKMIERVTVER